MRTEIVRNDPSDTGRSSLAAKLASLPPKKRTSNQATFAKHYEDILGAIERGVSLKDIREALAEHGLKLSSATFKRHLSAEVDRRKAASPRASEPSGREGEA